MRPYGLLVCGTNYGRSYLQAAQFKPEDYQVKGLLARGSFRSICVAERYDLPLYPSLEQVPDDIDIACVAVGSSVPEVMLGLLDKGIHVLAEHPQKPEPLEKALRKAVLSDLCLHINPHFSDLKAPKAFVRACRKELRESKPVLIQVLAADRAFYGVLDLLRQSFSSLLSLEFEDNTAKDGFMVLNGTFGPARISICLQTSKIGDKLIPDGSPEYLLDIQITAVFPGATLNLLSIAGPVIRNINSTHQNTADQAVGKMICEAALTASEFSSERIYANLVALDRLVKQLETGQKPVTQSSQALLEIAQAWEAVSRNA